MPRLLELFSGTGRLGACFTSHGFEVVSIDCLAACNPTLVADILTFDYTMLGGTFDVVWASCPCQMYSIARSCAKTPRDLEGADALVRRALEIIDWVKPRVFFLENPATGLLKTRDVVAGLKWFDIDYCQFGPPPGGAPYRKRTRIWTNVDVQAPRLCK